MKSRKNRKMFKKTFEKSKMVKNYIVILYCKKKKFQPSLHQFLVFCLSALLSAENLCFKIDLIAICYQSIFMFHIYKKRNRLFFYCNKKKKYNNCQFDLSLYLPNT